MKNKLNSQTLNIGELCAGHADYVREDIRRVVKAVGGQAMVKVILETAYLTDEQKVCACRLSDEAGASYVKTSTGFATSGCTVHDLNLMFAAVSEHMQVKAAGGIKTVDAMMEVIDAGVTRVGTRFTISILEEFCRRFPDRC